MTKFLPVFGQNQQKLTILEVYTLVSQFLSDILGNKNNFCLPEGLKIKILLKEFHLLACLGPNVGPCWVKNSEKGYFHNSYLTPNPVLPKREVLKSHSLLAN